MTKEKLVRLTRYLDDLTNRMNSPVPVKHDDRPKEFKAYLANEIKQVTRQIEEAKLEGVK